MEHQNEAMEIDLLELFYYLKKKIVLIAAVCLLFAVAGFLGTKLFIAPTYTTNTRMYVLNRSNENNVVTSDFQIANYFLSDYKVLITGQNVTKEVIKKLNLDMTPGELSKKIVVTSPDNTRVLQISITDTEPQKAADIANCVREVASAQIKQIMAVDAVQLIYAADVPSAPSGPSAMRNMVIVAALGVVAVVGVLTVIFVMDDTIRTEEDVERYLGLGTLGVVPVSAELGSPAGNKNAGKPAGKRPAAKKVAMEKLLGDSKK